MFILMVFEFFCSCTNTGTFKNRGTTVLGNVHLRVMANKVNLEKAKVMVSKIGQISIKPSSKKDQCSICGKKQWQVHY